MRKIIVIDADATNAVLALVFEANAPEQVLRSAQAAWTRPEPM